MSETQNNTEDNKRIAKNTLFLYVRLVFVLLISLYSSRIILNTLGVIDYGVYNVVAGFVMMFGVLGTSLTGAVQRFYSYERGLGETGGVQRVFVISIYIQLIIAIAILLLAETLGLWYVENKLVYPPDRHSAVLVVFHSSIAALVMVLLQIPYSGAIIAYERINFYAIVGVFDVGMKLIIALMVPYLGIDRLAIYGALLASVSVIDFLLYAIYAHHHIGELHYKRCFDRKLFMNMLGYAGWKTYDGVSQTVKNQGVNILINFFFGPVVNAARGISYQIKSALLGFVMNITTAANPQLVQSYASGNKERASKLMFTVSKLIFISLYIVSLPVMIEIEFVLHIWLGVNVPDHTAAFSVLVLIITMVDILLAPMTMIVSASGRIGRYTFWTSTIGLLILPLAYAAMKMGSTPEFVYVMSLVLSIIIDIMGLIIMNIETGVSICDYTKKVLLPIFILTFLTFPSLFFITLKVEACFTRFLLIFIASIILVGVVGYFIVLNKSEKTIVSSYVIQLINKLKKK